MFEVIYFFVVRYEETTFVPLDFLLKLHELYHLFLEKTFILHSYTVSFTGS